MTDTIGWSREEMAQRAALDIPDGAYVNLGIGIPELVAKYVPEGREVIYHTENGLLGMGPAPGPGLEDPELINAIPAVGGAMDLVAGVKEIRVITRHCTKTGESKLVDRCSYPLTAPGVVNRIYTDLAVIDIGPDGFHLRELAPGVDYEYVRERTDGNLVDG